MGGVGVIVGCEGTKGGKGLEHEATVPGELRF